MAEEKRWLGELTSFSKAYPEVKELCFEGREQGEFSSTYRNLTSRDYREVRYTQSDLPGRIPCSNPRCQQGGYDLNATLIMLTGSREITYEGQWSCNGHEGTPKGRRIGDPCMNSLTFKISLTYR